MGIESKSAPDSPATALAALAAAAAVDRANDATYQFQGRHMMASFMGCSPEALLNAAALLGNFSAAANATGATVLDTCSYVFPNGGVTAILLLSESHASIHTYPETGACFVDLFTCGETVDQAKFSAVMFTYLKPVQVQQNVFIRGQSIEHLETR